MLYFKCMSLLVSPVDALIIRSLGIIVLHIFSVGISSQAQGSRGAAVKAAGNGPKPELLQRERMCEGA